MIIALCLIIVVAASMSLATTQQQPQNFTTQAEDANARNVLRMNELHRHSKTHRAFKRIYDQYNYVEESQTTLVKTFGKKTLSSMRFLHIPKTGTTFAATFAHYCCDGLDGKYFDVVRQFNTILPSFMMKTLCDPNCFEAQPRSPNGDPWAHIPYRVGVDSHKIAVTMLRHPADRLASQLAYMQVIGPKLSTSFGFRRVDAHILFHLLNFNYDHNLQQYLDSLKDSTSTQQQQQQQQRAVKPTELGQYTYRLTKADKLPLLHQTETDFNQGPFMQRAQECIQMQTDMHLDTINSARDIYNLSRSATSAYDRLYSHFGGDREKLRSFTQCGLEAAVLYPGLQGCQTRMVLGRNCFDSYTVTAADVEEAKRRLSDQFLFIGITEQWNASIELFHRNHGGNLYSDELVQQRSAKENAAKTRTLLKQTFLEVVGRDNFDGPLYDHALSIFQARTAAFAANS